MNAPENLKNPEQIINQVWPEAFTDLNHWEFTMVVECMEKFHKQFEITAQESPKASWELHKEQSQF